MSCVIDPTHPKVFNDIPGDGKGVKIIGFDNLENRFNGTDEDDVIDGGKLDDILFGKAGDDKILGQDGSDLIKGGAGDDTILGGRGNDTLIGGEGDDKIFAQKGHNFLEGGSGDDTLFGGSDSDIFNFNFTEGDLGFDKIVGFNPKEDVIRLEGIEAHADISYNSRTGILSVDGHEIAFLGKNLKLTEDNFELGDPGDAGMEMI